MRDQQPPGGFWASGTGGFVLLVLVVLTIAAAVFGDALKITMQGNLP